MLDRRFSIAAESQNRFFELDVKSQDGRSRVGEDELQLGRRQPPVERHHDGSQLGQREEELNVLGAVLKQEGDAVAFDQTLLRQCVSCLVAARIELPVGEAPCRLCLDQGFVVGTEKGPFREKESDVLLIAL